MCEQKGDMWQVCSRASHCTKDMDGGAKTGLQPFCFVGPSAPRTHVE